MAASILVGVLRDTTGATSDEGIDAQLDAALRLAIDDVRSAGRLDRDVELVYERGQGLPGGTAAAVERAFAALVARDVLLIVGPAIGDNALVATPLADAARVPTVNWSGAGHARSEWMFQLQVGSHEDEPVVLARHLHATGARRVALVYDRSPIGRRYSAYFDAECDALGLDIVVRRSVAPLADDVTTDLRVLRAGDPDALVYLGLGVAGRMVGRARADAEWEVHAFMGAAGMFGHTPGVAADIDGWTYLDVYSDRNPTLVDVRARLGAEFARWARASRSDTTSACSSPKASPAPRAHAGRGA